MADPTTSSSLWRNRDFTLVLGGGVVNNVGDWMLEVALPVYIYLVQAVILLAGGLSSLYTGNYAFGVWGIFIFLSDSLVGLRAFPNPQRPIPWLNGYRILFAIILIYYTAQFALVAWAIGLSP